MNIAERQPAGRIAALEFILTQTLGIAASQVADKDTLFSLLRESFDEHAQTLPDEIRVYASEASNQFLTRAARIAVRWPARQ